VAVDEHGKAISKLDQANVELAAVQQERGQLVKAIGERDIAIADRDDAIASLRAKWGYRLQAFVERLLFWIKMWLVVYVLLNVACTVIPMFWGGNAAIMGISGILAKVCGWINPFSWLQEARRAVWKLWLKPDPSPAAAQATPATA